MLVKYHWGMYKTTGTDRRGKRINDRDKEKNLEKLHGIYFFQKERKTRTHTKQLNMSIVQC